MAKKKVTLSLEAGIYDSFNEYCDANAIMLSKKIELWIKDFMEEVKHDKKK